MSPQRVRMSRQHPWRADHPDAVIVARPTRWGNPFRVGDLNPYAATEEHPDGQPATAEEAVALFRMGAVLLPPEVFEPLRGRDLACWCPLDAPCHADVLLELANREPDEQPRCELARCPRPAEPGSVLCEEHQAGAGRRP